MVDPIAACASSSDGPRVLLVDDNLLFLRVLAAVLEEGTPAFTSRCVTTGGAALTYLSADGAPATARPDFVVLDFHLPDMDAPQVLGRLRCAVPAFAVPVLVLTQAYWAKDEAAALAAGATGFRAKPSSVAALRGMIVDFWATAVVPRDLGSLEVR